MPSISLHAALAAVFCLVIPAEGASVLSVGPRTLQTLVTQQLFDRRGRWYLIDDGACFTYLESPHAHFAAERLVLNAHLVSKLGQRVGSGCAGADFASNVTLSGKLRAAAEHKLVLDDIRIDRVDDESTRSAIALALQVDPQALPRSASVDVMELARGQLAAMQGSGTRVENLRISNVTTRSDALVIDFEVDLKAP